MSSEKVELCSRNEMSVGDWSKIPNLITINQTSKQVTLVTKASDQQEYCNIFRIISKPTQEFF